MAPGRGTIVVAVAFAAVVLAANAVPAQTPSPSPKGASVEGQVTGALEAGSTLTFAVDASMPGGWEALHLVEVVVRSGGGELERVIYDIEDVQLTVGGQRIVVGTGGIATGEHLRVSGSDVIVTTGGGNLNFEVSAQVLQGLPAGSTFELGVIDDLGERVAVAQALEEPASGGLTWETVLAFVAAALFVGAFIGNLFASKRRPPLRPSIYATVQRRLDEERAASGATES